MSVEMMGFVSKGWSLSYYNSSNNTINGIYTTEIMFMIDGGLCAQT